MRRVLVLVVLVCAIFGGQRAVGQFVDSFDGDDLGSWETQTGDGEATMNLRTVDGWVEVTVDATEDQHNIWWAVLRRDVSDALNLDRLQRPSAELRITARLRVSHAPRRVNLSLNTQRTTDYHSNLMEFDLPDTTGWHTVYMTTDGFDARPGDTVNAQLALMDWGLQTYHADVDSFAVEVVPAEEAGTAAETAVPYPLPVRDPGTLTHHVPVAEAGLVDRRHPKTTLADWHTSVDSGETPTWTVAGTQDLLLRWDEERLPEKVSGPGVLELTRHSVHRAETIPEEFGQVRVVEITGGRPSWTDSTLTYRHFTGGRPVHEVLNPQPIFDQDVSGPAGETVQIPISQPVLQRLVDGKTRGLALQPLGPVSASFYAGERFTPTLHLTSEAGGS